MVRFKFRYITVKMKLIQKKLYPGEPFTCLKEPIKLSLCNSIKELHGDYGIAATNHKLRIKYYNEHTQIIVIRVQHGAHRYVTSALPSVKLIGLHPVSLTTLYIGSSVRHCLLFIKRYQKLQLKKIWPLLSKENKKDLESAFLDVSFTI